jgi:FixJ family two-component response regulator
VPEKSPQTVFVVDDESVIVETLTAILNASKFSARGFENGAGVIEAAESGCPDLLVTDVSMPGMNGIDLAIRFRSLCPKCKIVLFSGHLATAPLLEKARSQGHDFTLLSKPLHPKDFLAAIRRL